MAPRRLSGGPSLKEKLMLLGLVVVAVACNSLGNYLSIRVYVSLGARSPAVAPMLGLSVWEGASQVRSPTHNPLHPRYSQLVFVIAESRFMYPPMPGIPMNENTIYALASEVVSVVPMYIPTGGIRDYTGEEAFRCLWGTLFLYYYNVVFRWCFTLPFHQSKSKNDGRLAFINNNF